MKKLAVLFPGIGYHCDKPLLYYSKKCLSAYGYEIIEVNYKHFPHMKEKDELIKQAEDIGYKQAEEILKDIPFSTYDEILFVSKIVEKMRRVIEKPIKEEIIETEANTSLIVLSFPNDVSTALVDKS